MSIGEVIRRLRLESGRSLESVAKELGISRQTMSRYETGVIGAIPYDNLVALAKIYGVSPAYLMGWENDTAYWENKKHEEEMLERLRSDPELRMLLSASAGLNKDDMQMLISIAKKINKEYE